MKWERIHPRPDAGLAGYDFANADKYVEFGKKNGMFIVGHCLIWHSQVPRWVFQDAEGKPIDRARLLQRMHDHIFTVVRRYKGRVKGWDVVNEALNEDGTLRRSPWFNIIGEDYIAHAFAYAHEADPKAELYYNDYNLEYEAKRKGVIDLVKMLKKQGIKITAIGTQSHHKMDRPTVQQIDDTLKAFRELGIKVAVTELDVDLLPAVTRQPTADGYGKQEPGHGIDRHEAAGERAVITIALEERRQHRWQFELLIGDKRGERHAKRDPGPVRLGTRPVPICFFRVHEGLFPPGGSHRCLGAGAA